MSCTIIVISVYLWAAFVVAFVDVSYLGAPKRWRMWSVYLAWPLLPIAAIIWLTDR